MILSKFKVNGPHEHELVQLLLLSHERCLEAQCNSNSQLSFGHTCKSQMIQTSINRDLLQLFTDLHGDIHGEKFVVKIFSGIVGNHLEKTSIGLVDIKVTL